MVNFGAPSAEKREMAPTAQALQEGDDIVAGTDAVAEVEHFDGSLTRLDAGATAALQRIADPTGRAHLVLDLGPGASWHRTSPLRARGSKYEARTPAASALARSASFVVRGNEDGTAWFAALSGTVIVRGRAGGMVVLRGGETVSVTADGALADVADPGLDILVADEWVAVNALLDAEAAPVADAEPPPVETVDDEDEKASTDRERPWRVGVAAGLALGVAVFSVFIGRAGTKQPAQPTRPTEPESAVTVTVPAPPAVTAPPAVATPATPPVPAADVTNRSCTRAGGGMVTYTGSLHSHATATTSFRVHVRFLSAQGAVVATTTATVAGVPADGTRTVKATGAAGRTATACEVSAVEVV